MKSERKKIIAGAAVGVVAFFIIFFSAIGTEQSHMVTVNNTEYVGKIKNYIFGLMPLFSPLQYRDETGRWVEGKREGKYFVAKNEKGYYELATPTQDSIFQKLEEIAEK